MNCPKSTVLKCKIHNLQQELFRAEEELKAEEENECNIKIGDIIVLKTGRRLQLLSVYHFKGKTLILVNLDTGTIYRQRYDDTYNNPLSSSKNDFIVPASELVWPVWDIISAFRIGDDNFSYIMDAHHAEVKI